MRVLMLNRGDAHSVLGGDTIQMLRTKTSLEKLGVQVESGSVQDRHSTGEYDVVHVFNWQQLQQYITLQVPDSQPTPPLVLSPIFWYYTGHWYDEAVATKPYWHFFDKALGSSCSRRLYEHWQRAKFRWGAQGSQLRNLLTIPARLLPNSSSEAKHLDSVLGTRGYLQTRCSVIPNGVERVFYDPRPLPNKVFLEQYGLEGFVLQVARIQSAKNQLGLIEALFDVTIPIVFIGQESPYEPAYTAHCHELARQRGNVYFTGPMPVEEIAGIYVLAGVHVLPSWRETPGLVSLEAAAAGCRIVSTSIGSAHDYFGDDAWYCDPRDPQSIKEAVFHALAMPHSEILRKLVLEHYTWDVAARATLNVYREVLEA